MGVIKKFAMRIVPIGVIRTPFTDKSKVPIQPFKSRAIGRIMVYKRYGQGLQDIEGFSHLILIFRFHRSRGYKLLVKPFLDIKLHGLFSTRAPRRPNQIGMSVVKLLRRRSNILTVKGIDVLDKTPLIDIKPYVPEFSATTRIKIGWLRGKVKGRVL